MSGVKYIAATEKKSGGISPKRTVVALIITFITVALFMLIASLVLTYTPIPMSSVSVISRIILLCGAFVCGFWNGAGGRKSGWLLGLSGGTLYMVLITVIGMLVNNDFSFSGVTLVNILSGIILGALGGIFGINSTKSKKYKKKK
jgi:putative membrane protein (TIGR04086 family)